MTNLIKRSGHHQTGPRDVFTHLLVIIFLYVVVFNFGALLFQYINVFFPDVLVDRLGGDYARRNVRFPISILVIVFPLFVWLTSFLQKELARVPEKRDLKTRKWLLYFTLFLTTIAIVADLVALIFRFLSGELTLRFVFKILAVLVIAAAVFLYYGWNLRKRVPASQDPRMKLFTRVVVLLGAIAVVGGFFVAGSPQTERERQFDDQRVHDLSLMQREIVRYWIAKDTLPETLGDLRDELVGFIPPTDPKTGEVYEYRATGELTFELCAVFTTISDGFEGRPFPGLRGETFSHKAERTCFERTIDPDRVLSQDKPIPVR